VFKTFLKILWLQKKYYKNFFQMASWQNSQGRENHKSLWEEPVKDRCLFCGSVEEIKCQMTIQFSEFEYNTGPCCKRCYSANAKQAQAI
jgi:hypothetical protein